MNNSWRLIIASLLTLFWGTSCKKTEFAAVEGQSSGIQEKTGGGGSGNGSVTFSGQASAVNATVLGVPIVLSQTQALPSSGGAFEATLLEANVPGVLTAQVLHAATLGMGDRSRSEASVADLNLTIGGNTISAAFLQSRALASCGPTLTGSSEIAVLVINGDAIVVSGEPNQTINLPLGGQVIINEQTKTQNGSYGAIDVNVLHIIIPGVADVKIASVHADIKCLGNPPCNGGDFVTGGGWITGTPSGSKGNFGVAGGIRNGSLWGHLTYIDHGTGLKVKATAITAYVIINTTTRQIDGTCEINGVPGTFSVIVSDKGEPGRNDTFDITLSNGYKASGKLIGGNIQLHKPCK
jgi:hypothetical protein